jgi:protease-4
MPRALALALALTLPSAAAAQTANLQDVAPRLNGVAVPNATVAGGEEPAAFSVNAASPGFVKSPSLQYFHEGSTRGAGLADVVFLTAPLGGLVPTLSLDWIRPSGSPRFRRTSLGAALSDHRSFSVGGAWTWVHSPDPELDRVESYSLGVTIRPTSWLSLAASGDGFDARLAGEKIPARWNTGFAVRTWRDRLTLSADLLASDRGKTEFDPTALAFGANVELRRGLVLFGQLQAPLQSEGDVVALLSITVNSPHAGATFGGGSDDAAGSRWLAGARLSSEAYRSEVRARRGVSLDLEELLSPPRSFLFGAPPDPFGRLLARLRALRDDPSVAAVALTIDTLPIGIGRTGELRAAVSEVAARKPVVAYLRGGRLAEYWLATAAAAIHAPPAGDLEITGIASATPFLRDGLAKIGVAFDVVAVGRYKNAPDPLVRRDMSEAQREAQGFLLDGLFDRIVADVARARGLPETRVRELVDEGLLTTAAALDARLLDGVSWPDELDGVASARAGRKVSLGAYRRDPPREAQHWGPRPAIAIVPIEGTIVPGKSRGSPLGGPLVGGDSIAREIQRAADDRSVRAIVLRIDSPGGDALASDLIWREVIRARAKKPVIASLGDTAASGGYLAAVGAHAIVADPSTITGSIGVFALKPDLSGLLEKLGVNVVTLRRGERADLRSVARPWSEAERRLLEKHVLSFYEGFKSRVADGRRVAPELVEQVAGGRVWTGAQAKERGLVDRLGTFEDALDLARERAGLGAEDPVDVRRFEPPRGLFEAVTRFAASGEPSLGTRLVRAVPELATAMLLLEMGDLVALPLDWLGDPGLAGEG